MLLTWHNVRYYQRLMQGLRQALEENKLQDFVADFYENQKKGDINPL